ncbi:MAG: valine--tRNA ligase [candidate division KSB1 bacterium]|nr:valine--tRNA ligase [candidate division KSB1 bacterium]MDZ7303361.1 valine--tRNA ligase [candidate division KSB1 bacterium]MDZ7312321.1 valine--tRNA ligase [candidate division KSB1 bacterium]
MSDRNIETPAGVASQAGLDKVYNPKEVEDKLYQFWLERNYFHAEVNPEKPPYTIVIPPPNVTAQLHMGHAYDNTLQDILIRFHKMRGYETEWMPGTDHAGIATQNAVEKYLAKTEKKTRHDLGREEFVRRVWEWKEKYGSIIIDQLKKLGCACDWARTRFTMDEGLSRAVAEVFVRLYHKGLIYRGRYIINWCPRCRTALSDEEAEHKETSGKLWYIKYPIYHSKKFITVATTRPETMLGDVAVAVHPEDKRYKKLIGKTVWLPILYRKIPIIADPVVDPKFGTGAVKVTPAHDPNDFLMGERHRLVPVLVMNDDATMNANAGPYEGLDRFEARKRVVEQLEREGLLERIEEHTHAVGHCYRCGTMVEPYLSTQWFVKMKPLAEPALEAVRSGKIQIRPTRWIKVYTHWMENIRDWCISRQLWWGHRIPVYYCENEHLTVSSTAPEKCIVCESTNLRQDPDVLDTWFSSWLWPFSTFGWPEDTPELKYFYPGSTLVSGHEIIFFWVARMIMAGMEFMGDIPFRMVYLHGIVRDAQGRKMSKSLGNGIDPLDMISKYSADAVRLSLLMLSAEGSDINLAERDFEIGRNFTNKVWNAYRFLAMNLDESIVRDANLDALNAARDHHRLELVDRWMLSRYSKAVQRITAALNDFHFHEAIDTVYNFFWKEYCDWYLELIKPRLNGDNAEAKHTVLVIATFVLKNTMKLLHPFAPFISEAIWRGVEIESGLGLGRHESVSLMISNWPEPLHEFEDERAESEFALLQEIIGAIRNLRGEMNIPVSKTAEVLIAGGNGQDPAIITQHESYFKHLARVHSIMYDRNLPRPKLSAAAMVKDFEIYLPLAELIDVNVERNRLEKERQRLEKLLEDLNRRLHSEDFVTKAPQQVVERERQKKTEFEMNLKKILANMEQLAE